MTEHYKILRRSTTKDYSNKRKSPLGIKIILGILCGILVCSISAFAYVQYMLGKINKANDNQIEAVQPEDEEFETDGQDAQDDSIPELDPNDIDLKVTTDVMKDKDVVNILLIGQDRREGEGRARSDSMILATFNKKDKSIHLTSFMRDLYVEIPEDYSANRLNAAYQFGGMDLLDATIESNFGVSIDGNIEVDFSGFQTCVDKVGGVDMELNKVEVDYLNKNHSSWQLKEGMNHLTGEQVLAYSRIRYVGNADYERTERQRKVLMTVFNKMKDSDLKTIFGLINELFPLLTTDIPQNDMLGYAYTVFQIGTNNIESDRIPIDGAFQSARVRGMQVLVPDLEANRKHLQESLYDRKLKVK
ncbi:MAG: LCP family protein [Lachnospiraceae bacterium]